MKNLFLCMIVPATVSFFVQSILCRKVKKGILRHAALILSLIPVVFGIILLLTHCRGMFGGLGVVEVILWFNAALCAGCGYGAAWLIYHVMRKNSRGRKK